VHTFPRGMRADAVIVGAGASGTLVATQLLRQSQGGSVFLLVERTGRLAEGLAYSTREPAHLLNVPACGMSALADHPGHFLEWLRHHMPGASAATFAPRTLYGRYLAETLLEAQRESRSTLLRVSGEVTDLAETPGGLCASISNGWKVDVSFAVLAMGNPPPENPREAPLLESPWSGRALENLDTDASVLLLGTGLTMADTALSLHARGHRGPIYALSRHGLLPARHQLSPNKPAPWSPRPPATARELLRQIRARAVHQPWREVMDGLRPITQRLWLALSDAERSRFLRHLRTFWDVHRHRMAPQVAETLDSMWETGQLRILAGRLLELREDGTVRFRPRGTHETRELRVDRAINCTGPASFRPSRDPLMASAAARGLLRFDERGLSATPDGACNEQQTIFAAGPLLRGALWESTAIPEIRTQAHALASGLLSQLERDQPSSELQAARY
jgi:uncharacterized NAD(P)/FAD-binding protein YdhS